MFRNIVIGARKSTLAKLQAYHVGSELAKLYTDLHIEYKFQESSGDKDLTSPLWKMEGRGVFTRDLQEELLKGNIHCIVHSWKDLDLEDRPDTDVISVLPREDQRDVFLFKKSVWNQTSPPNEILVCTSSPRREYNLKPFLSKYLPSRYKNTDIRFTSIRGNIQTRLRKFLEGDYSGLVMAKAGLDRLLSFPRYIQDLPEPISSLIADTDRKEFNTIHDRIREYLMNCKIMVLPLSANPNAPAQGALALELLKSDDTRKELISRLTHKDTEENTLLERKILGQYGGGCHQKIGVAIYSGIWGKVQFTRGLTDAGVKLQEEKLIHNPAYSSLSSLKISGISPSCMYPSKWGMTPTARKEIPVNIPENKDLFVARKTALPDALAEKLRLESPTKERIVWTAGRKTWSDLASRDIWVHGTTDSLGEREEPGLSLLLGRDLDFVKLTHNKSKSENSSYQLIPTYEIEDYLVPDDLDWEKVEVCFWRSGTEFDAILQKYPHLKNAIHFCGLGSTLDYLESLGLMPIPFYSYRSWMEFWEKNNPVPDTK